MAQMNGSLEELQQQVADGLAAAVESDVELVGTWPDRVVYLDPLGTVREVTYAFGEDSQLTFGSPATVTDEKTLTLANDVLADWAAMGEGDEFDDDGSSGDLFADEGKGMGYGVPQVAGSWEERQDALTEALKDAYAVQRTSSEVPGESSAPGQYVRLVATFDDHVLMRVDVGSDDDGDHFTVPYTVADNGDVALGDPTPIDLSITVTVDTDDADNDLTDLQRNPPDGDDSNDGSPAVGALPAVSAPAGIATKTEAKSDPAANAAARITAWRTLTGAGAE